MEKLKAVINKIKPLDPTKLDEAQRRLDNLTKPLGSLGRLEELAKRVVAITGKGSPSLDNKVIITMAGDHGVTEEKVSAYPKEVTPQMVYNFLNGGAGINVLARHVGARVVVVDMGVADKIRNPNIVLRQAQDSESRAKSRDEIRNKSEIRNFKDKKINFGTKNIAKGPAMTKEEAIRSIEAGIEVVEEEIKSGMDILGTGDMGIGNTTPSSAIACAIIKEHAMRLVGRGTGIDDETFLRKVKVIEGALKVNKPDSADPIDVLAKVGGFEIGGITGVILAGAAYRIPVVIDGFISGAAALLACGLSPNVKDYIIASHCSVEPGHKIVLDYLGLKPLLNLNMRLGEGTGAALAINLVEAGIKILTQMATFQNAGVSQRDK